MVLRSTIKRLAKGLLARSGYEIRRKIAVDPQGFALHRYLRSDGSFDYEQYRRVQIEGNKNKLDKVWAAEENIALLSEYIKRRVLDPRFGICHGTRRGKEQEWFRKYLGCEVIGTEISDTATQFPHTIQWDFHETKPEWIDSVDFIYSNAFDHSYAPEQCLNAWMTCVKRNGVCILEHSNLHGPEGTSELDPFGADITHMPYLIAQWGKGQYGVRELLSPAVKNPMLKYLSFVVIQRF